MSRNSLTSQGGYTLLILSTVLIAAGGYVIKAIFDQESYQINNDTKVLIGTYISESAAYNLYAGLTITGVGCGFILANSVEHSNFAILFVLVATLLYFYASSIKNIAFIGNILIASILSFSIIIIGIFDLLYTNVSQIWLLCHRFGRCALDLTAMLRIRSLCLRFDCYAKDLAGALD